MSFLTGILDIFTKPQAANNNLMPEQPERDYSMQDEYLSDNQQGRNEDVQLEPIMSDLRVAPTEYSVLSKTLADTANSKKVNKSMLNHELFNTFFKQNYFSRGRHNGINFGSEAHFEAGRKAIIADFQGILMRLIDHKRRYIQDLQAESLKSSQSFPHLSKDLDHLVTSIKEDIETLQNQTDLSDQSKGWISKSINDYENGFIQGKQYGIKIRLLNNE